MAYSTIRLLSVEC